MQASMWTSYLVEHSPAQMVRTMTQHGWKTCELSDEHGHDLLKQGDPATVGSTFRALAEDVDASFPQGHFYLCTKGIRPDDWEGRRIADVAPADAKAYDEAFEDMKRWIDLFNAMGIRNGVLHAGGLGLKGAGWTSEAVRERRIEAVGRIAEYARGGITRICLENLTPTIDFADFADISAVVEGTGMANVGYCLDTGHANISGVDNAAFIRQAGTKLWALHIADNLGTNDDHMLPFGRGTVPWAAVMTALHEIGYDGLFNFEVPGENHCPMPVRLAKLDYALRLANSMMAMGRDGTAP